MPQTSVIDAATKALEAAQIDPASVSATVPGSPQESTNLFDISQILGWLAKERGDIQEQMDWRDQIPALIAPLANS